jgi:flagellar hook-associated protein 3 FlgL
MVDEGRSMKIGMPGSVVFGSVQYLNTSTGATSSVDMFTALGSMYQALVTNDSDAIRDNLDKISSVHEHLTIQQANIGSRMKRVETLTHATEDRDYTYKTLQSSMEDLDYVEAASRLKNQSLALQAGQQTFAQLSGLSLFKYIR